MDFHQKTGNELIEIAEHYGQCRIDSSDRFGVNDNPAMNLLYDILNDVYLGRDSPVDKILRDVEYTAGLYRRHLHKSKSSMIEEEVEKEISKMLRDYYECSGCNGNGDDND